MSGGGRKLTQEGVEAGGALRNPEIVVAQILEASDRLLLLNIGEGGELLRFPQARQQRAQRPAVGEDVKMRLYDARERPPPGGVRNIQQAAISAVERGIALAEHICHGKEFGQGWRVRTRRREQPDQLCEQGGSSGFVTLGGRRERLLGLRPIPRVGAGVRVARDLDQGVGFAGALQVAGAQSFGEAGQPRGHCSARFGGWS